MMRQLPWARRCRVELSSLREAPFAVCAGIDCGEAAVASWQGPEAWGGPGPKAAANQSIAHSSREVSQRGLAQTPPNTNAQAQNNTTQVDSQPQHMRH
ncbi:hypothetical protein [Lysobacter sp. CA199]|uniref:hypothetical protein n=1 Tax=Lysobacter sp. CA199 TaxID=3455608 RepID=UPI003F8D5C54